MSSLTSTLVFNKEIPNEKSPSIPYTPNTYPITNAKTFYISTLGIPLLGLPLAPSELVTNIFDTDGVLAYTSTRAKRGSGSCTLSSAATGDLITTTYRFGPGKPPVLRYVDTPKNADGEEIQLRGKWLDHSQAFTAPGGRLLEWRYVREMRPEISKKTSVLVLVDLSDDRRLAQLVRTNETRTEGSKKCSAGNGGQLGINEDACGKVIDDVLVIATCLVMLKKEIDRRRRMQAMVLSAAIGGAAS